MNIVLNINLSTEKTKITSFIKSVLRKHGFKKVVIGMSGGVDSTTAFYLLRESIAPENIIVAHLYYLESQFRDIGGIVKKAGIPKGNIYEMSIDSLIKAFSNTTMKQFNNGTMDNSSRQARTTNSKRTHLDKIRIGNIAARIRMIILYDLAKKHNALVCGTENKSEFMLGYFTRFGDEASDFEPIQHLYKTQIFQLARFLEVPKNIMEKTPTAGLWHGQTDEGEFGFSYKEADEVLFYYYDKKLKVEEIKNMGFKNADRIINYSLTNNYKHLTPYTLDSTDNYPNTKYH